VGKKKSFGKYIGPIWDGGCGAYQQNKQKKSRRTVCDQRAFADRPRRDKRAFELEAKKTREARSAPLSLMRAVFFGPQSQTGPVYFGW